MKKFIFISLMLAIVGVMATGCSSCQSENKKQEAPAKEVVVNSADYDGVVQDFTAGTKNIVALHRQTMFNLVKGHDYQWRNLQVLFNDFIKTDNLDDLHITDITSVYFYWEDGPWVQYISTNIKKGTIIPNRIQDVWIEDGDMSNCEIKLGVEDVLKRLKEWNGVIPEKSNGMVLRLPVGPRNCNAQWVIGSFGDPIFIDAVTGYITEWCPAFPIPNVNGPLGEWP